MKTEYSTKWSFLVFLLAVLFIYILLGDSVFTLNNWVYGIWGDAIKNYYHVLASAKKSEHFWLSSVNHPFGENIFFLDAQPLLSQFLSTFHLENYAIGFVNGLPIFSLSITAIFIFLIQRELKLPLVLNLLTTLTITFLSPQVARMTGHFSLAYTCYIPILIYLIFKIEKKPTLVYFFISLTIILFSFLHLYYLLIGGVLIVSMFPYHLIKKEYKNALYNLAAVLLPFVIIKTVLYLSDPVLDRPDSPFGIWAYRATFAGVFNPPFPPFETFIHRFVHYPLGTFESSSYVGILAYPILLFAIYLTLKSLITKQKIAQHFDSKLFMYLFYMAFLIWFIALYYPLKIFIDPALNLISALKQFRSLGRFSWILYYVFSIFISLQLWHLYQYLKNKKIASLIICTLLLLWFVDAYANMNQLKNQIAKHEDFSFNESLLNQNSLEKLKQNKYDAILSLPLFHVGSEIDNELMGSGKAVIETFKTSNLLEVPYISTFSSRVSTSQFYKVKYVMDTGKLDKLIPTNKKLLVIADLKLISTTDSIILSQSETLEKVNGLVFATYIVK